jgi:hypothetical protein
MEETQKSRQADRVSPRVDLASHRHQLRSRVIGLNPTVELSTGLRDDIRSLFENLSIPIKNLTPMVHPNDFLPDCSVRSVQPFRGDPHDILRSHDF